MRGPRPLAWALGLTALTLSGPARAETTRAFVLAWGSGGYDTNPLVVGTGALPSAVTVGGAALELDLAFGPLTRLYLQGGAVYTALPELALASATGFADLRALHRTRLADLELRATLQGVDVQSTQAGGRQTGIDLSTVPETGDSTSISGALSAAAFPPLSEAAPASPPRARSSPPAMPTTPPLPRWSSRRASSPSASCTRAPFSRHWPGGSSSRPPAVRSNKGRARRPTPASGGPRAPT